VRRTSNLTPLPPPLPPSNSLAFDPFPEHRRGNDMAMLQYSDSATMRKIANDAAIQQCDNTSIEVALQRDSNRRSLHLLMLSRRR